MQPAQVEVLLAAPDHDSRVGAVSIMDFQARRRTTPASRREELYRLYLGRHDLVQKALGGWVREAGKRDRGASIAYLDRHARTMPRTVLRYAIEHLDPETRSHYLGLRSGDLGA